ncbi:MAG: 4-(cytidine 5'-diphospho)-2-C-methyl-D-erythritol kinase [Congregibacter sp.]
MQTFSIMAPAKLNLFLHVTGRRPDGYHNLQTVFQLLDYGDELHLKLRSDKQLRLNCTGPRTLADTASEDNLVIRAARLLALEAPPSSDALPGVDIRLVKKLPAGGGLGGGSSDAASTLLALNYLWGLGLGADQLATIGSKLGADVAVFVRGQSAWAEGIGDELTPLELPERWYLVVTPECHISTPGIFSHPELTRDTPAITMAAFFTGPTRNDCERVARSLSGNIDKALIFLENFGEAKMTGSGASVFLAFDSKEEAGKIARELPAQWQNFVARGVNSSPALRQMAEIAGCTGET